MKWRVILEPDPETQEWAVWCPELPGCVSAGSTEAEALVNIREAIELYLEPEPIELAEGALTREVIVPYHKGRDLPIGTLRNILTTADIPEHEWKTE